MENITKGGFTLSYVVSVLYFFFKNLPLYFLVKP